MFLKNVKELSVKNIRDMGVVSMTERKYDLMKKKKPKPKKPSKRCRVETEMEQWEAT